MEAAQFCISLLMNMSKFDDRSHDEETKEGFSKAIQIGLLNLHKEYKDLRDKLPDNDIRQLDSLKQKGFYSSHFNQNSLFLHR